MSLTRFKIFLRIQFLDIFCHLNDRKHKVNGKIFYIYRADIVNFEKIASMSILSYRCNVGVLLVVPLVVFNSTSYTQDLRFYLVQLTNLNPRIWHMTAISCQIINLKVAKYIQSLWQEFPVTNPSKFIPHHSRATCQLYTRPPGNENKKKNLKNYLIFSTLFWIYNCKD